MTDPLTDLLDDGEESPGTPGDGPKALRDHAKSLEKQLKAAQAKVAEAEQLQARLAEYEAKERTSSVTAAFQALGLNPKHAAFYPKDQESDPEAIKAWAVDNDFLTPEEDETPAPPAATPGFTPTVIAGSVPPGSKVLNNDEFGELLKTNPNEAFRLYQAGRVKLDSLSDIGGESVRRL